MLRKLFLLAALAGPAWSAAEVREAGVAGRVVAVQDGDTVTILDADRVQHRVRLAGIDAPEKGQPFGMAAKQALSVCAFGKTVRVEGDKRDRYGRLVGKVVSEQGDCNLRQVRLGLAWHYKQYQREQPVFDRIAYGKGEEEARGKRAGLWCEASPTPPWDYRRDRRDRQASVRKAPVTPANCR